MNFSIPDFVPAIPEIFILVMACVILLQDVFLAKSYRTATYLLTQVTLVSTILLTIGLYNHADEITFNGSYILDHLSTVLKCFILGGSFFIFLYSRQYVEEGNWPRGEYYVLSLFSILGMMVLVSAYNFVTLYLGLELLSLPLYALIAMRRGGDSCAEAAIKYFVMGALASGMLLYGLSMIYGATKSLDIGVITQTLTATPASENLILVFGLVFMVAGVVFKLGGAPFHMWVPDVYEGSPASVTLFVSSVPKLAGFAMAIRLLVDMMPLFHVEWQHMLMFVAIFSMGVGNFVAIVQTNIRRMLAYSSIAHIGYMLLGLLAGNSFGYMAASFYIIIYTIMTIGAFGIITILSRDGVELVNIDDLKGLNTKNPWLAFMMLLLMFSMAGIPPLAGFFAKVSVLEAVIGIHLVWLAVLALLFAIIGAYYYLRVVKVIYFEQPEDPSPLYIGSVDTKIAVTLNGLAVLFLGIFPSLIFNLCRAAF